MDMDLEDSFMLQLAKAIQTWLWVESELYLIYAMLMKGANSHLVSVTFNSIQSIDAKLVLLSSCLQLAFARNSQETAAWRALRSKVENLNRKRNKLVHEPVHIHYNKGTTTVSQGPSYFNALSLVKGQTTHQGGPVISSKYDPTKARILEDHRFTEGDLYRLQIGFREAAHELQAFREAMDAKVAKALNSAKRRMRKKRSSKSAERKREE
jgi:hypothetical protein